MAIAETVEQVCLVNDVKVRYQYSGGDVADDPLIAQIIAGVSGAFDVFAERNFMLNPADVTEYYDGGMEIYLKRWPVFGTLTSVKISADWDWAGATALVADTDYRLQTRSGRIYYLPGISWPADTGRVKGDFPCGIDNIQVIYRGGYVGPDGDVEPGGTGIPADVRDAAIVQAGFYLKRRHDIGLTAVSAEGQNITKFAPYDLLPSVKKILARHKR